VETYGEKAMPDPDPQVLQRLRQMQNIRRLVHEADSGFETRVLEAGRRIGEALAAYNVDAGHDRAWLADRAWPAYYELMVEGFEQVNLVLGLPPDYRG
jgi:hypothetical protein